MTVAGYSVCDGKTSSNVPGYVNLSKGHRRLDELLAGDLHCSRGLIERLPAVLDVPTEVVAEAVAETKRLQAEAREAAWRAAFVPHAIALTEKERPSSITMAAFSGMDRRKRIDFTPGLPPVTYLQQALRTTRQRSPITFYGEVVGVIVNYSPDRAIKYDMAGNIIEVLTRAVCADEITLYIRNKPIPSGAFPALLSGGRED
jgi:hypothetical protein